MATISCDNQDGNNNSEDSGKGPENSESLLKVSAWVLKEQEYEKDEAFVKVA